MTKLLHEAISVIERLSDEEQDEIAFQLFGRIANGPDNGRPIIGEDGLDERIFGRPVNIDELDDQTRAAVLEGLACAERGEFASDEEMAALFKRHGLCGYANGGG